MSLLSGFGGWTLAPNRRWRVHKRADYEPVCDNVPSPTPPQALSEANLWIARPVRPNLRLHPPLFYLHNENTSCLLDLSFHIPPLPATQSDSFCCIGGSECPKHLPLILVNNCFSSLLVNEDNHTGEGYPAIRESLRRIVQENSETDTGTTQPKGSQSLYLSMMSYGYCCANVEEDLLCFRNNPKATVEDEWWFSQNNEAINTPCCSPHERRELVGLEAQVRGLMLKLKGFAAVDRDGINPAYHDAISFGSASSSLNQFY
nr:hypothetical protein Iba_chr07bCG6760 [Ipomoea batatas]